MTRSEVSKAVLIIPTQFLTKAPGVKLNRGVYIFLLNISLPSVSLLSGAYSGRYSNCWSGTDWVDMKLQRQSSTTHCITPNWPEATNINNIKIQSNYLKCNVTKQAFPISVKTQVSQLILVAKRNKGKQQLAPDIVVCNNDNNLTSKRKNLSYWSVKMECLGEEFGMREVVQESVKYTIRNNYSGMCNPILPQWRAVVCS